MSAKFKDGDLVVLKAGGPQMVIEQKLDFGGGAYRCSWFSGAKHNREDFKEAALKLYVEDED